MGKWSVTLVLWVTMLDVQGGGLYVIVHEQKDVYQLTGCITVENCTFDNNSLETLTGGGVAATIVNHN